MTSCSRSSVLARLGSSVEFCTYSPYNLAKKKKIRILHVSLDDYYWNLIDWFFLIYDVLMMTKLILPDHNIKKQSTLDLFVLVEIMKKNNPFRNTVIQ